MVMIQTKEIIFLKVYATTEKNQALQDNMGTVITSTTDNLA